MPTEPNAVSFTVDDALRIANALGSLAVLAAPASAAAVAAVHGCLRDVRLALHDESQQAFRPDADAQAEELHAMHHPNP